MKKKSERERMLAGELYIANDEELKKLYETGQNFRYAFSLTHPNDYVKREQLIRSMFGSVGKNVTIQPPIYVDYGSNIYVGDNFYANYDCIFLDVCEIKIGDNVMFGPRVAIYTAEHPLDPTIRNTNLEFGRPVTIGNNVWVGGSVTILGGVTIGDNVVVGAGSLVNKDLPSNVIAAGNPARIIRTLSKEDKIYWEDLAKQYWNQKIKE